MEKKRGLKRNPNVLEKALGLIIYSIMSPLFFAGRKKILLDHDLLFDLYVRQEQTCDEIAKIVGHSEDLVHRTLRGMEKNLGVEILRDRNADIYKNKRRKKLVFPH